METTSQTKKQEYLKLRALLQMVRPSEYRSAVGADLRRRFHAAKSAYYAECAADVHGYLPVLAVEYRSTAADHARYAAETTD